eukprot:1551309-Alexandrium_andersonii.AAC.1
MVDKLFNFPVRMSDHRHATTGQVVHIGATRFAVEVGVVFCESGGVMYSCPHPLPFAHPTHAP